MATGRLRYNATRNKLESESHSELFKFNFYEMWTFQVAASPVLDV